MTKIKWLSTCLFGLISFSSYGQEMSKDASNSGFSRVQIGINISPDICYRTLHNNDGSSSSDFIISRRDVDEWAKFGYSAGLNVCFNLNKVVGLQTGIHYSNKGYKIKTMKFISGQSNPNIPQKATKIYNFHYIDIPLTAYFTNDKTRFRFFTSIGLTTNIFIIETRNEIVKYFDHTDRVTTKTNDDYKKLNISPTISFGVDWKMNSRMNLRVEPTFRYGVIKINDAPVTSYLYNGGLNLSYYFAL
jgi:hypothetical protein